MFLINAFEPPRSFDLHTGEFVLIGRGEHCDVKLDDPSVSRVHCRVLCRDGRVMLTDAGSRWGTFVNGERVEQAELRPGDRVRVGETLLTVAAQADSRGTTIAPLNLDSDSIDANGQGVPAIEFPVTLPVDKPDMNSGEAEKFDEAKLDSPDENWAATASPRDFGLSHAKQHSQVGSRDAVIASPPKELPVRSPVQLDTRPFVPARFLGKQFLRYQVESLLSHSRTGLSFIANDPALQRKVVIKIYRPELLAGDAAVARFLRAVRTMINFRHANLVQLFDAGEQDGFCYTITQHVRGVTAEKLIRDFGIAGMLDWQTTVRIGIDLCRALGELHSQGIVHRDIRPSHILITNDDKRALIGEVVLAKAWDRSQVEQLTAAGDVVGDLAWQSPEQLGSGEPIDHRSDLYQLGVALYSLLTGQQPFNDQTPSSLIQSILTKQPPSPKSVHLSVPDLLADVILRLLSKRPADRQQSADAAREELERVQRFATT